jgi:predicted membrane-bound spermidine synthase
MSNSSDSSGGEKSAFDADVAGKIPSPSNNPDTYSIPGGLSGWMPGDVTGPNAETGPVHKAPARNEPQSPIAPTARKRASSKTSDAWALRGYNLLVFLSSVCVMTLELTASRLIAKHVGSSLYTWTSVIGVVLAGITIGNYLGGWLADRYNRQRVLSWMFLAASLSCTSVLWLDQIVAELPRPESFSWPAWILCVVAMMFLLPAVLLGTTSPLVASMALARSSRLGMTVGNVYAWGALGSIVGTFLTGFYLIDVWGTRAIVGLTAGTLAALAVAVAGQRWVFRTAVLCGWLQLLGLIWMSASLTSTTMAAVAEHYGEALNVLADNDEKANAVGQWRSFGSKIGEKLHEFGLLLQLRDDQIGGYHDESSYSYISVGDDYMDGEAIRYLRLDKLVHSYYNPDAPTTLHYEYEQVYAAVTKRAAPQPEQNQSVVIAEFPGWDSVIQDLPEGVTFEAATRTLHVPSASAGVLDQLLHRSTDYDYWAAVEELHLETNKSRWGGFSTVSITEWPEGLVLPEDVFDLVRYDTNLEVLSAYKPVSTEHAQRLLKLSPQAAWRDAIESLRRRSASISTLFLGGGGYIFPRWVLTEFPGAARIDVAELDPAVHQAVQRELGLTPAEEQRIHTTLGDARNFVDDRLRANARLIAAGDKPVQYDFIYGDAFNDFGVPWHLTTREFTQKLAELLSDRGVFLANIIEIYPRTRVPSGAVGKGSVLLEIPLPDAVSNTTDPGLTRLVRPEFHPLTLAAGNQLQYVGEMTFKDEERYVRLADDDDEWTTAIRNLAEETRKPLTYSGTLPDALKPAVDLSQIWTPCPEPFAGVETYRVGQGQYTLGFRGAVSDTLRQKLIDLDPGNASWTAFVDDGVRRSRAAEPGRFLARYTLTMTAVFPCVYIYSTSASQPTDDRDTLVVVCSKQPLDLSQISATGLWSGEHFAGWEQLPGQSSPKLTGQMDSVLALAEGQVLTDDFAPVDILLRPVFVRQDE